MISIKQYFTLSSLIGIYAIGIAGILFPPTRALLLQMYFFILLLTLVTLAIGHQAQWNRELLTLFSFIVLASYIVEVIGVKTGRIFGFYTYGTVLGPKLMQVPPMIGVIWLLLIYCTYVLSSHIKASLMLQSILGAAFMTAFDVIMELAAKKLGFWSWTLGGIPIQNYLAWFTLSLLFHALLRHYKVEIENKRAIPILALQVIFMLVLAIFL
jgi:putative membrane protein